MAARVNEDKTGISTVEQGFYFVGFHFRPDKGRSKGKRHFSCEEQEKRHKHASVCIKKVKQCPNAEARTIIREFNPILRGWAESNGKEQRSERSVNILSKVF
jgi:hypothetical protein